MSMDVTVTHYRDDNRLYTADLENVVRMEVKDGDLFIFQEAEYENASHCTAIFSAGRWLSVLPTAVNDNEETDAA